MKVGKRNTLKLLLATLTAWFAVAFPLAAKEATPSRERVMVFGDSLCAAFGINPKDGWVALMEATLRPSGVSVVNASISGETTGGGKNRIQTDLASVKPTIVVVALGANDGLRGLANADTRKNLEAIILAARQANARVVLVGMQIPPNYGLEYTAQFRKLYRELADKHKLTLVPFLLEGFADDLSFFQADRLHPTAAAQRKILDNVLPSIQAVIAKTASRR